MMPFILLTLFSSSLLLSAVIVGYLIGLAAVRCLMVFFPTGNRNQKSGGTKPSAHRIAILIPAHNEEAAIARTIDSCIQSDYAQHSYQIFVIADNCTDNTASVVHQKGIVCLERHDADKRGKGHALAWAFQRLTDYPWDAVMVVDADCELDPRALTAINAELQCGSQVLQINNRASNPDDGPVSFALALANTLENDLFYTPKSALGLAVFLRGTGFVLHRDILKRFPWNADSIVEDAEYTATLFANDIPITFLPEVSVRSDCPVNTAQMAVQRSRWVGGGARWAVTHGLKCMWQGLRYGRLRLFDAGLTSFVTMRAILLLQLAMTMIFGSLCISLVPGRSSSNLVLILGGVLAMHATYVALGFVFLGVTWKRLGLLACVPIVSARHTMISVGAIARGPKAWRRTPRTATHVLCEQ